MEIPLPQLENPDIYSYGFDKNLNRGDRIQSPTVYDTQNQVQPVLLGGSGAIMSNLTLSSGNIQSSNYVSGSSGWKLTDNGDIEGNSGVFRGNLLGSTITGGIIQTAASGERIILSGTNNSIQLLDSSGGQVFLIKNTTNIFNITNSGNGRTFYLDQTNANNTYSSFYILNQSTEAGGHGMEIDKQGAGSASGLKITMNSTSTGHGLYIDSNSTSNSAYALAITRDGNSAGQIIGMLMSVDNVGAGGVLGIDLSSFSAGEPIINVTTDATDPTGGGGAAAGRIAINVNGVLKYLAYY